MAKKNRGINLFRNVPKAQTNRTEFPILHDCDFSGEFGFGYPVFCQEVLPGDTWHIMADHFSRLAPMVAPVYHDFDVRFHWFYVPMRLLWDDFEDWMTGGRTGTWREDNPDAFPVFRLSDVFAGTDQITGSLLDYLGVGTKFDGSGSTGNIDTRVTLPVMPVRGYYLIYNYFFRDQNVTEELEVPLTSGVDEDMFSNVSMFEPNQYLFKVAWDKDYFTSATLSPQRGPQVFIPLAGNTPLVGLNNYTDVPVSNFGNLYTTNTTIGAGLEQGTQEKLIVKASASGVGQGGTPATLWTDGGNPVKIAGSNFSVKVSDLTNRVGVDLSATEGAAVDDVREAFALQRFFERMQVIGSRFAEFLRGIWGTYAGDSRLQMPEYLGTWTNPFMINNVSNTTGTTTNPQAGYAGNGLLSQFNKPIHKNFPENGYLYCIYSAMPRNGYQQGLAPIFCRRDWLDFANPMFEHIGEQPIKLQELYFDPSPSGYSSNDDTFGYQSQYANYKFINSHSHGEFKTTLNFWHANRIFDTKPSLSREFIEYDSDESTSRVFVLPDEPKFYTTIRFNGYVERNLSAYSTPRII